MKNLKKISRNQLKQVNGGAGVPNCKIGYIYMCGAMGICDDNTGEDDCLCICRPIIRP